MLPAYLSWTPVRHILIDSVRLTEGALAALHTKLCGSGANTSDCCQRTSLWRVFMASELPRSSPARRSERLVGSIHVRITPSSSRSCQRTSLSNSTWTKREVGWQRDALAVQYGQNSIRGDTERFSFCQPTSLDEARN